MQTVKIRLRKPTRVFTFVCPDLPLRRGDACVVRSDRGLEYGTVVLPPEPCADSMQELVKMNVLRKASPTDETTFAQVSAAEQEAKDVCADKIREHGLAMKLVDVEYTLDKHKVIFYFTAAERVDFRQLVRDLAQILKTRIELRHIQVRDEAKLVGGLGVCGRELCCATWLRDFKPISMKMAKRQNLSLNPTKISGQCGRLLCCLSYEFDQYPKRRKKAAPLSDTDVPPPAPWTEGQDEEESPPGLASYRDMGHDVSEDQGSEHSAALAAQPPEASQQQPAQTTPPEQKASQDAEPQGSPERQADGEKSARRRPRRRRRRKKRSPESGGQSDGASGS